jgi:hypothetical protein
VANRKAYGENILIRYSNGRDTHRAGGVGPLREARAVEGVVAGRCQYAADPMIQTLQAHWAVRDLRRP